MDLDIYIIKFSDYQNTNVHFESCGFYSHGFRFQNGNLGLIQNAHVNFNKKQMCIFYVGFGVTDLTICISHLPFHI